MMISKPPGVYRQKGDEDLSGCPDHRCQANPAKLPSWWNGLLKPTVLFSLENPDVRVRVLDDPFGFLKENPPPVILDEIQYVPQFLRYVKAQIDMCPASIIFSLSDNISRFSLDQYIRLSHDPGGVLIYAGGESYMRKGHHVRAWWTCS